MTITLPGFHLRNIQRIPGTNDLHLAEATRAVKNPGKGSYVLILLGPATTNHSGKTHLLPEGYTKRGVLKPDAMHWKVIVHSPTTVDFTHQWVRAHRAEVHTYDHASARRLLIALAKEMVMDR